MANKFEIAGGEYSPSGDRVVFDTIEEAQSAVEFLTEEYPDAEWHIVKAHE